MRFAISIYGLNDDLFPKPKKREFLRHFLKKCRDFKNEISILFEERFVPHDSKVIVIASVIGPKDVKDALKIFEPTDDMGIFTNPVEMVITLFISDLDIALGRESIIDGYVQDSSLERSTFV